MGEDDPKGLHKRATLFKGENYAYWKENIYVNLMSIDKNPCEEVTKIFALSLKTNSIMLLNSQKIGPLMKPKRLNII